MKKDEKIESKEEQTKDSVESLKINKDFDTKEEFDKDSTPFPFLSHKETAGGIVDEDEQRAQSELVRFAFNFASDKIWSWSRWRAREIPLIARVLMRQLVTSPNRPKNPDGSLKSASQIYLELIAWLRLAENGQLRSEAMQGLKVKVEEENAAGGWTTEQ